MEWVFESVKSEAALSSSRTGPSVNGVRGITVARDRRHRKVPKRYLT